MNFLPIVERELRVTARRGTTQWARFALTLVLALATMNSLATTGASNPGTAARSVFTWLMGGAFVLACAACVLTADALSGESREGTLGLLFLTDLRSWDVTLGKMASSGLGALYVGLALIPVLMLPVLAGGVSAAEAARAGVSLVAIILFALAAGLAASAREHERGHALRRAGLWVSGTVLLPPVVGWVTPGSWIAALSPMTTLRLAQDVEYRTSPMMFWLSLTLQVVHAVMLLVRAGSRLQRQISEPVIQTAPARSQASEGRPIEPNYSVEPQSNASYRAVNPPVRRHPRPRGPFEEASPLEWLVRRQRGQLALCWLAAFMFVFPSFSFVLMQFFPMSGIGGPPVAFYSLYQLSWLGDALLAWVACRFFFEARRSGELELLLTTPAGAQTMVSAHWAAMKRLLRWPAVIVLTPFVLQGGCSFLVFLPNKSGMAPYQLYSALYAFLHAFDLILLAVAVNWLGMLFGLTMRRLVSAIGLTLGLAVALPMLLYFVFQFVTRLFFAPNPGSFRWLIWMFSYYPVGWALLLALIFWARHRLRRGQPAELFQVDWRHAAQESMGQLRAALRRWRWLNPGA